MLVNGVPVLDADRFMRMNTDDFYSIAVVAGRYFIGNHIFYGIIDVRLNNSVHQFGANARVVDYNCLEPRRIFISPDYSNESSRLNRKPDFRSVLYWNPFIETDNTGNATLEFYTSDLEGEYVVVVNAIARNGQISMGNSLITVK
jgi:hypothetical protein